MGKIASRHENQRDLRGIVSRKTFHGIFDIAFPSPILVHDQHIGVGDGSDHRGNLTLLRQTGRFDHDPSEMLAMRTEKLPGVIGSNQKACRQSERMQILRMRLLGSEIYQCPGISTFGDRNQESRTTVVGRSSGKAGGHSQSL